MLGEYKDMPYTSKNKTMKRKSSAKRKTQKRKPSYKKRSYKPTASFNKQMVKYNNVNSEKKIMPMINYLNGPASAGYLDDLPCLALSSAGLTVGALSVKVLQTGRQLTQLNQAINNSVGDVCSVMDGYSVLTGTGDNRLIGAYAKITSSYINMNITMDPVDYNNEIDDTIDNACPHQFRVIQVKARRDKMVSPGAQVASYGVPSLATNLFRDESGEAKGITSACATQDIFTWFINRQFWTILKDERFTLAPTIISRTTDNPIAFNTNGKNYPNSRFKKYWLPKPSTKVRFESNTVDGVIKNEIVDYNYVVHTIVLCKNISSGERASNHWSIQANGATAFIDE